MWLCSKCQNANVDEIIFCQNCGFDESKNYINHLTLLPLSEKYLEKTKRKTAMDMQREWEEAERKDQERQEELNRIRARRKAKAEVLGGIKSERQIALEEAERIDRERQEELDRIRALRKAEKEAEKREELERREMERKERLIKRQKNITFNWHDNGENSK